MTLDGFRRRQQALQRYRIFFRISAVSWMFGALMLVLGAIDLFFRNYGAELLLMALLVVILATVTVCKVVVSTMRIIDVDGIEATHG